MDDIIIGVLSLQGAVSEHFRQIKKCGAMVKEVRKPRDLEGVKGLIIPGGESTTIGYLMQDTGLDKAIKEKNREGMPLYGTCAGMVLLAKEVAEGAQDQQPLGLIDVIVKRNAFGRQKESFEADIRLKGWDHPVTGVFIRAPLIIEAGLGVDVLAFLDEGIIAARQNNVFVTSFHPELTDDLSVHRFFIGMCLSV